MYPVHESFMPPAATPNTRHNTHHRYYLPEIPQPLPYEPRYRHSSSIISNFDELVHGMPFIVFCFIIILFLATKQV